MLPDQENIGSGTLIGGAREGFSDKDKTLEEAEMRDSRDRDAERKTKEQKVLALAFLRMTKGRDALDANLAGLDATLELAGGRA